MTCKQGKGVDYDKLARETRERDKIALCKLLRRARAEFWRLAAELEGVELEEGEDVESLRLDLLRRDLPQRRARAVVRLGLWGEPAALRALMRYRAPFEDRKMKCLLAQARRECERRVEGRGQLAPGRKNT